MDEEIWTCSRCGRWTADVAPNATAWEMVDGAWVCPGCLTDPEELEAVLNWLGGMDWDVIEDIHRRGEGAR